MSEVATIAMNRYASIHAAVAEGFTLDEVLSAQAVAREVFDAARIRFALSLRDDPAIFDSYSRELARAQDAMRRRVTPLDDDLPSWLAFSDLTGRDAEDSLLRWELGPNDLARLARHWQVRLADPEVQRRAREARARGLPPLRHVHAGPKVLITAAEAEAPATSPSEVSSSPRGDDERVGLAEVAAIEAELMDGDGRSAPRVLARFADRLGLPVEALAATREHWHARIAQDESVARDFHALVGHHRHRRRLASSPRPCAQTVVHDGAVAGPATPFVHWRPRLTLEQFAALSVELTYQPDRAEALLVRHGLDPKERAAHEAFYRRVVEASDEGRMAWSRAYAAHRQALLLELRRRAVTRGRTGGA